jgi:hypothetical protein
MPEQPQLNPRQRAALAAWLGPDKPTDAQIARRFGVSRSAISHRLAAVRRYCRALGKRHRMVPMQLSLAY